MVHNLRITSQGLRRGTQFSMKPEETKSISTIVLILVAVCLPGALLGIISGAILLWIDNASVDNGYIYTDHVYLETASYALLSAPVCVDTNCDYDLNSMSSERIQISSLAGWEWYKDLDIVMEVTSTDSVPIFVGVAEERSLMTYLNGVEYSELDSSIGAIFSENINLHTYRGTALQFGPSLQEFWKVSDSGSGLRLISLTGELENGRYRFVIMSEDGSKRVAGFARFGIEIGDFICISGLVLLLCGIWSLLPLIVVPAVIIRERRVAHRSALL